LFENQSYIYQGEWHNTEKHGEGIAFLKNGTLIAGHWCRDRLHGRSLIFSPFGSVLSVNFIDNKLNGWAIAQFSNKVIICVVYFEDKVDGLRIIYEGSDGLWIVSSSTARGQLVKIAAVEKGERTKLPLLI
jgi:antitoxin component YwqK of YwqJK toxin-antitoxin module